MTDFNRTTAVVLAGGLGSRLRDVLGDEQKVMAEVRGRPFLYCILDAIDYVGIKDVVLCTGYKAETLEESVGTFYKNLTITFSREFEPLGTGGALRSARKYLVGDHVLVMNGDSYAVCDYKELLNWHICKDAQVTVLLTWANDTERYGSISVDDDCRITSFSEKNKVKDSGWINAGVYLFQRGTIDEIPGDSPYSLEWELFPSLAGKGIFGFPRKANFIDIGIPESYALADEFFKLLN